MAESLLNPPKMSRPDVRKLVTGRIAKLVATKDSSATRATLASLRANITKAPGTDPAIWDYTIAGVSPEARADKATFAENAAHLAMCLFALHQQSRSEPMQKTNVGLGNAVAQLDRKSGTSDTGNKSPVRRRFDAVITSSTLGELSYHLRGLVQLLRAEGIGIDYGLLAQDLLGFQQGKADRVVLQWARQFHHLAKAEEDYKTAPTQNSEDPTIIEEN